MDQNKLQQIRQWVQEELHRSTNFWLEHGLIGSTEVFTPV